MVGPIGKEMLVTTFVVSKLSHVLLPHSGSIISHVYGRLILNIGKTLSPKRLAPFNKFWMEFLLSEILWNEPLS
jgi:hypothetical protein